VSDPTITTSAKEMETGKVEEITGTSADAGEGRRPGFFTLGRRPFW
jgi:hypothetical protein